MTAPEGLLVVDKPGGWTSHDVVARVRRLAGTRKVGHAGTLDPMATGVLVLGLGRATRLLGHLALTEKEYLATVRLGETTVTDDSDGAVLATADPSGIGDAVLAEAMARLTGTLLQVPSSVSAVKVDGVRSYARVRAGEEVALAAREVVVSRFALLRREGADLDVAVTCTSGTYVRALARDLGADLGVGAHLRALRRERVGPFVSAEAASLDGLEPGSAVLPLDAAVGRSFPRRDLTDQEAVELSHGRRITATGLDGPVGAFAPDGCCVALVRDEGDSARPAVVFAPAGS